MTSLIHRCPKCGAYFNPPRDATAACPQCGIWFRKWKTEPAAPLVEHIDIAEEAAEESAVADPVTFYGRLAGLAFVAIWGIQLSLLDYRVGEQGESFMHNILLPIHEAGHIFFMPLGHFMMILGGSFFQVALPLGIGVAFLWKQREPFGAAMMLWWAGASLVDLSPYVWDSLQPQLTLLGGHTGAEGGPHDWIYLLGTLGILHRAHGWGVFVHHLGVLMMFAGVAWGGWFCWKVFKVRREAAR
ncbi:MAG: hypothetical protein ABIQ72_18265 [Usitatibacter sp.]